MSKSWLSLRLLVLSLIGTVLLASVGLGLIFNLLFEHFSDAEPAQSYSKHKALLATLATSLDTHSPNSNLIDKLGNEQLPLSITSRENFPLPQVLSEQLDNGQPLVLESAEQVALP